MAGDARLAITFENYFSRYNDLSVDCVLACDSMSRHHDIITMEKQQSDAELYAPDIEELIDWDGLADMDPQDIKAMIPLIMSKLLALIP